MFTIENLKNRLINHSVALKHTFDENAIPRQGALIADKGTVFFVPASPKEGERSKWVMTTISKLDDANLTKIECNRMAKEFVKKYPLPELQKEFLSVYLNTPIWTGATIEMHHKADTIEYLTRNNIKYEFNSEIEKINNLDCIYFSIYISPNDTKKLAEFLDELHCKSR